MVGPLSAKGVYAKVTFLFPFRAQPVCLLEHYYTRLQWCDKHGKKMVVSSYVS